MRVTQIALEMKCTIKLLYEVVSDNQRNLNRQKVCRSALKKWDPKKRVLKRCAWDWKSQDACLLGQKFGAEKGGRRERMFPSERLFKKKAKSTSAAY